MKEHGNVRAQIANKNARKGDDAMTAMISFRCHPAIKARAVKTAQKQGVKLQEYLIKLIDENAVKFD